MTKQTVFDLSRVTFMIAVVTSSSVPALESGFDEFGLTAGSHDHSPCSRDAVLLGDLGLLFRIDLLKFDVRAEILVLGHQIVECAASGISRSERSLRPSAGLRRSFRV